jgi:predicted ABC-type transport system involved in lysophospholipase L1 biosynthesis ATPase subunit
VTPSAAPALELSGISKDYRGLRPLRIQKLIVGEGERVALVGLDQVSAEVFVNLVTGATLPDTGRVALFGRSTADIADSAEWLAYADRFGIVSDRAVLLDQMTTLQNLAMPFTLSVEPMADDVRQRAERLALDCGIPQDAWDRVVGALDPLGRARVRVARALALAPVVLLLEHVSAGLTAADASTLSRDVASAAGRRRAAVVAATADESFARSLATRVLRWDAATGRLTDRRGWFGGRLG